jgi:hypothetical protein
LSPPDTIANTLTAPVFLPPKSPVSFTAYKNLLAGSIARNDGFVVSTATSGLVRAPVAKSICKV